MTQINPSIKENLLTPKDVCTRQSKPQDRLPNLLAKMNRILWYGFWVISERHYILRLLLNFIILIQAATKRNRFLVIPLQWSHLTVLTIFCDCVCTVITLRGFLCERIYGIKHDVQLTTLVFCSANLTGYLNSFTTFSSLSIEYWGRDIFKFARTV